MTKSDDLVKSRLGYEYDLKDALKHNPTTIMAGDDICAVALSRIEELEAAVEWQCGRAEKAEAKNARLREALREAAEVSARAVRLSREHADFKLYAMEPMERAINKARAALEELKGNTK